MSVSCPGCDRKFDERFNMLQHASTTQKGCWSEVATEDKDWWVANYGGGDGTSNEVRNIEITLNIAVKAGDNIGELKLEIFNTIRSRFTLKDKDGDIVPNHVALGDVTFDKKRKMWLEAATSTSASSARTKPY